ncbi:ROK family glucokinase [Solicola sp. PLA-1-18]|uniref:ROK family glucokinase n=1 Tax=Solicola sp. PLA-1-18 TaxID=3380532 RepID=UPI003B826C2E
MAEKLAIGIDIGGTKVKAGVVDLDGHVVQRVRRETPTTSPSAVLNTIADIVSELRAQHHVISVGIGAAGFVDATRSTVLFSPHLAWRHEPLRDAVRRRIGLSVIVDNDANAAAWAEWKFGAAQNEEHLVCITLGTGIGGALVIGGNLHRGRYGLAGEFGHMQVVPDGQSCECGNRGCWEQYASGNVLIREAQKAARDGSPFGLRLLELAEGDLDAVDGRVVTAAAHAGDEEAVALLADVGRWLGVGIANLAAAFDPGIFVVGGGVSDADELLLEPARAAFRQGLTGRGFRPEAQVVRAHLGNDAGMIGAADMSRALRRRPRATRSARRAAAAERPRRAAREPGAAASLFAVRRDR